MGGGGWDGGGLSIENEHVYLDKSIAIEVQVRLIGDVAMIQLFRPIPVRPQKVKKCQNKRVTYCYALMSKANKYTVYQ